jgi:hypothetical protein
MNKEYLGTAIIELLSDPIIEQFISHCQINKTDIINSLLNDDKTKYNNQTLSISNCFDILSGTYNYNWKDDGLHCIVYKARGINPHTHCGTRIKISSTDSSLLVCDDCKTTKEGKKIIDNISNSNFDMGAYHAKKIKRRTTAAKMALKKREIKYIYIDKMISTIYDYDSRYWYVRDLGLVVKPEIIDTRKKYVTIGVDKNNVGTYQTLDISDLKLLKNTSIIINVNSLNDSAAEYIKNKITSN